MPRKFKDVKNNKYVKDLVLKKIFVQEGIKTASDFFGRLRYDKDLLSSVFGQRLKFYYYFVSVKRKFSLWSNSYGIVSHTIRTGSRLPQYKGQFENVPCGFY